LGASRCGDKLNLDIGRIVNSDDSTEIPQLETSISYVVGESDCLVQDEHDLLRKCGDEPWLSGLIVDKPDRSEWPGFSVGAFQSSTDDYFHPIGAHLDPLNHPSLPMVEQIITKSPPGFNGIAE
jgi:hypothetical protein